MHYWELRLRLAATMMLRRVVSISGVANRTQTVRMKRNVSIWSIYMENFGFFVHLLRYESSKMQISCQLWNTQSKSETIEKMLVCPLHLVTIFRHIWNISLQWREFFHNVRYVGSRVSHGKIFSHLESCSFSPSWAVADCFQHGGRHTT